MDSLMRDCEAIRLKSPLVLNITNYVAMNFSANALLAVGASPFMSSEPDEMNDLVRKSAAVVINTGCIERHQADAMQTAASLALTLGIPWVLDPVGAGMGAFRDRTLASLLRCKPALIRGNASEIMSLAGADANTRGADAGNLPQEALPYARALAADTGAIVAVSGGSDLVTDGNALVEISGGSPVMAKVTAMGCTASAVAAAFLAVNGNRLEAVSNALGLIKRAGEKAAASSQGPGTFVPRFIDALGE